MTTLFLPVALIVLAGFFQGTFGLGMKYTRPLAWEAWWTIYSLISMILFPVIWAVIVIPDLFGAISNAPSNAIWSGMLFGFLWGIGGILFGVSVNYVGVSITYGIVMGLAASVGSVVPLVQIPDVGSNPVLPFIVTGVVIMLVGVAVSAIAGVKRDKLQAKEITAGNKTGKTIGKGLLIAISSGILSASLNIGFINAAPVASAAEELGAISRNASLAAWVVVLFGAFVMNGGYVLFLLSKNKSWKTFGTAESGKAYKWAVLSGLFWFGGFGAYGQGAALMGELGPVVGWPILLGLALIISNVWGVSSGEWKGAKMPLRIMFVGVFILIIACGILGYSNKFVL
jgi:L-rhamnose-H+ transport protein